MTNTDANVARLIEAWRNADTEAMGQRRWYWAMNAFALGLSRRYNVSITLAANVIAVISPRLSVEKNMAYAELLFATGDAPIMGVPKRAALALIGGADWFDVVKNGPKITSFAHNIANPADSRAVTIDRHIYDWLTGSTNDAERKPLSRKGAYEAAADTFRAAADHIGVRPHELQAVVWFVQKSGKVYDQPQHTTLYAQSGRL